jgi:hypothetical protein
MTSVNLRPSHLAGAAAALGLAVIMLFWAPWSVRADNTVQTSNVAVNCEPRQQAVVRQTVVRGELQVSIQCVQGALQPIGYVDEYGRPIPAGTMSGVNGVGMTPAVYSPQALAPQPLYAPAPRPVVRQTSTARNTDVRSKRSWQKTALVIGGSTGAGAGVGGLIGGKKGALIGAAIGGGSATLFEALKR